MKSSVSGKAETIEFELKADELLDSPQATASPLDARPPLYRARALCLSGWVVALALGVALAVLHFGVAKQRISRPAGRPLSPITTPARQMAAPEGPSTAASKQVTVRIANPFDRREIFEFPPGTSREYARTKVAEFLLDRARGRHVRHEQRSRSRRELRNS